MTEQIKAFPSVAHFDYELYEGDPDQLKTVNATPSQPGPHVEPSSLKLKYRIGHGPLGDVWLATHHQSGTDYDEHHEVALKMVHPVGNINEFLRRFEHLWVKLKSRRMDSVCWLHGISVLSGKICIALRSYEGSVGDRLAHVKGGKLPLPDILRYGIEVAKGVQQLHQIGALVLNLKPNNFLLDERDHIALGDFGIPHLLLGIPWLDSDLASRLGTPNYMAPEQWEPGVRGPISHETDSWGFACSMIELLTGIPPWFGQSIEEIHHAVVIRGEKPLVPDGLPPEVEDILKGCFEYDLRNRPLMSDILQAFERSRNAIHSDGSWSDLTSNLCVAQSQSRGYTTWYLLKNTLHVGDTVQSRKAPSTSEPLSPAVTKGVVVGLDNNSEKDGFALVRIPNSHNHLRLNVSSLERVSFGFSSGDWVRLKKESREHSSLGILHHIGRDGCVAVGFLGLEVLWRGNFDEIRKVEPFFVGHFVRLKAEIKNPRFEWPHKRREAWACGKVSQIFSNGCLGIEFPGRFVFRDGMGIFLAHPEEVERVSFDTCPGIVEKYKLVEDFHWAVRPITVASGLLTVVKVGTFVGKNVGRRLSNHRKNEKGCSQEGGNSKWLPTNVTKILFKEGTNTTIPNSR
ncbi:protein kinase [Striga asiatica]|uniref:Protein kinase n=1 Tax=Striga asiatica TaxID=4170 RepID=A0A5A7QT72_STRAF|nr:protein kinase [Striga asiatica]